MFFIAALMKIFRLAWWKNKDKEIYLYIAEINMPVTY